MSLSFLLDSDTVMYGNPVRHLNLTQPHLSVYPPAPYPDYTGYHPVSALADDLHHTGSAWSPREDWLYGHATGPSLPVTGAEENIIPPAGQGLLSADEAQDWMRRAAAPAVPGGKTRTKDKYRVVYSDIQRLELEKEFHFSRYITIRRKAELAVALSLSERQVKIWFQNRRAKERKINKKRLQQVQQSCTQPSAGVRNTISMVTSTDRSMKEEH